MTKSAIFTGIFSLALLAAPQALAQGTLSPITPLPPTTITAQPGAVVAPQVVVPNSGFDAYATRSQGGFLGAPAPVVGANPWGGGLGQWGVGSDQPKWIHRTGIFAEALYLNARDNEVIFAAPLNVGVPPGTQQILGAPAEVGPDYDLGFRAGFTIALDTVASIVATYSHWKTDDDATFDITGQPAEIRLRGPFIAPLNVLGFPLYEFRQAEAAYDLQFDLIDLDYRLLVGQGDYHAVNVFFGARYGKLEERFGARYFDSTPPAVEQTVGAELDFKGVGPRVGIDAERHSCATGFFLYGRAAASFLVGKFEGRFEDRTTGGGFDQLTQVVVDDNRVVTTLDVEAGVGWQSPRGRVRLNGGYMVSTWINAPTAKEFVTAAPLMPFHLDVDGPVTFDGFTGRVTLQW